MTIVVTGMAACTPVGLHADASCAALRSGMGNLMELATLTVDGEQFEAAPMIGGRVPTEWLAGEPEEERWPGYERFGLPPPPPRNTRVLPGVERVLELNRIALTEIRHSADLDGLGTDRYRVYLGLNEHEPAGLVLDEIRNALGGDADRFAAETSGRASGLSVLERAAADLREGRTEGALIGGVDSLIRRPMAERLDHQRRIRCKTAPEGFNPGEAAAFVFVESARQAANRGRTAFAQLSSITTEAEPSVGAEEPNQAVGLAKALRAARANAKLETMPLVVCDLNGERPRALEWSLAVVRALGDIEGDEEVWHPADCIGDTGAAAGVVDLVWACTALYRRYAPRPRALVWGASDGGLRAAAVLDRAS